MNYVCPYCGNAFEDEELERLKCPLCNLEFTGIPEVITKPNIFTALKNYAKFSGRASRREYWLFKIIIWSITIISMPVQFAFQLFPHDFILLLVISLGMSILGLLLFIPNISVTVRRLHDLDLSGWLYLLSLVPGGSLILIFWGMLDSQPGANRFGANPKGVKCRDENWRFRPVSGIIGGCASMIIIVILSVVLAIFLVIIPIYNITQNSECRDHLMRIGQSVRLYQDENEGFCPNAKGIDGLRMLPNLTEEDLYCPVNKREYLYIGTGVRETDYENRVPIVVCHEKSFMLLNFELLNLLLSDGESKMQLFPYLAFKGNPEILLINIPNTARSGANYDAVLENLKLDFKK